MKAFDEASLSESDLKGGYRSLGILVALVCVAFNVGPKFPTGSSRPWVCPESDVPGSRPALAVQGSIRGLEM